jgi:hypothetical protein
VLTVCPSQDLGQDHEVVSKYLNAKGIRVEDDDLLRASSSRRGLGYIAVQGPCEQGTCMGHLSGNACLMLVYYQQLFLKAIKDCIGVSCVLTPPGIVGSHQSS